ncbi:MAG: aminotransferase class I/II-fold pyridoxal phosphate-dependent enzyme [Sediminibacterium sp.]|jgi:methionine-gamma-lyase|uniref:trans-sulfuration enzyme family protein n=1 Tax=Sediminibacterium sp. TaxID=1917865 RepID=UPI002AB8319C|nr:aminotransferase class I/II-fold pyridoxal phosphate-dependent enzyme [Sediminibacterium sp.]MDZ4072743.1 aminotransferase class I/II-fold pyridoxal phosphate-dependent enzyme [Sediminibacterium sp.]
MSEKFLLKGISSTAMHAAGHKNAEDAHLTPIFATSTFTFDTAEDGMDRFAGTDKTRVYSRWGNPTFTAAEETIAALEAFGLKDDNGQPLQLKALLHSSGQAAMSTLFLSNLKAGDAILSHYSLYGGTQELMTKVLAATGIEVIIVDMRSLNLVSEALQQHPQIKLVHIETPANPTIQCVDIAAVTKIAKTKNVIVSVDNTFATPYLQQPFKFGVDYVFHSTTKFLNGHGTAIGGVLLGKDLEKMRTSVWKWHVLLGGNSNPFDAFLLAQGMKTLEIRMERHCANAQAVAAFLEKHPAIAQVNFTGLSSHPDHELCKKQMRLPGAVMSFELKGGLDAGKQFINQLQMCVRAISLGTVDTLVSHPASMSHFGIPREERLKYGITDGLIRLSVGIENIEDIIRDLDQALQ